MKALLSVLFSLTLWFGQVAVPVAYAEEPVTTEAVSTPTPINTTSAGVDSRYTSKDNPNNVIEGKSQNDIRYKGLTMTNIALFSTMTIAGYYFMFCATKPSAMLFMASGALFVGMEILNWANYKKASEREMKYYTNQDHDSQVKSLEAAAKQTEEAAKAAKNRAMVAKLAAAGMIAAAAVALIETYSFDGGACAANYQQPNQFDLENQMFNSQILYAMTPSLLPKLQSTSNSVDAYFVSRELQDFAFGEVSSPTLEEYENFKDAHEILAQNDESFDLKEMLISAFKQMSEIVIPSATAKEATPFGPILSAAGPVAMMYFFKDYIVKQVANVSAKTSGIVRAGLMAGSGAFALMAGVQIQEASKKLSARAGEYRKLAATMHTKFENNGELANRSTQQALTSANQGTIKAQNVDEAPNCLSGKPLEISLDAGCSCRSTNSCLKTEVPKIDNKGFSGASVVANTADLIGTAANALSSGNTTAAASLAAANADKQAARVNRLKKSLEAHLNKKLTEKGQKPIDFAGLEKDLMKSMAKEFNTEFNKLSDADRSKLAGIIPSLTNDQSLPETKDSKEVDTFKDSKYTNPSLANIGSLDAGKSEDLDFKFDLEEKGDELAAMDASLLENGEMMNGDASGYEAPAGSEINPAHESLWNIIHKRYLKNYDRFFARKKDEF